MQPPLGSRVLVDDVPGRSLRAAPAPGPTELPAPVLPAPAPRRVRAQATPIALIRKSHHALLHSLDSLHLCIIRAIL